MLGFEIQTRTALTYFESFSSWRELLYGSHEAGKQLYWVIAGKYFLLLKNSVCRTYNWIFRERNISGYDIWQKTHLLIKLYIEKTNEKWLVYKCLIYNQLVPLLNVILQMVVKDPVHSIWCFVMLYF